MTLCRHKNDAGNCLLCGTKPIREPVLSVGSSNLPLQPLYQKCPHGSWGACWLCEWLSEKWHAEEDARQRMVDEINERSKPLWDAIRKAEYDERWPGGKCAHGVYLKDFYCGICSLTIVEPDYNIELYRRAVSIALKNVRRVLGSKSNYNKAESRKDLQDVWLLADFEVWKATQKYGDKMNDALAYTVAHNTAQKFLANLIEDNSVLVGFQVEFADDHERDQIETLFRVHGDVQTWSRDVLDGARPLIIKYGRRIPRNLSFDNVPEDAEYSQAELKVIKKMELEAQCAEDPAQTLEGARPALQALVATWRGEMRAVGEAMLRPGFNVRGVPGMSKSQVSRSYQRVAAAFRALIAKGL